MTTSAQLETMVDDLTSTVDIDCALPLHELTARVGEACDQAEARTDGAVVVLRLHGASTDGREWPGDVTVRLVNRWERALRRLERLDTVVIAAASGPCQGPALDLLLTADYRIGAADLQLVLPVNDGHFWPGMSVYRLVQHLGMARARQIVLWGTDISAPKAAELGLIDAVTDHLEGLLPAEVVLAGRVSDKETAIRRRLLLEAGTVDFDEALGTHLAACDRELRRLQENARSAGESETTGA
ncbi:enoyl-CoA-hydratase DpgB [Kitasatospora sp. NPDC017646]|uniref:enoyl-CoA-hydratase DpgB n=1 Tax=Kitasatospora sp. NPDC017646 TaxID=3364024 RepID=UPI0037925120